MVENKEFLTSKWWILLAEVVSAEQTTQIDGFDVRNEVADFFKHIIYIFCRDVWIPTHSDTRKLHFRNSQNQGNNFKRVQIK